MNDTQDPKPAAPESEPLKPGAKPKSRRLRRWTLAGLATAVIGVFAWQGLTHAAHGNLGGPNCGMGRFMHARHGAMDADTVAKFIDWRVSAMLSDVDATPEQKTRIGDIAKGAAKDLLPLREQHQAARDKAMALLIAPNVDRAALEKLRADEFALAETVSRRITRAVGDAAEVLTPAQREKIAQKWKQRHANT